MKEKLNKHILNNFLFLLFCKGKFVASQLKILPYKYLLKHTIKSEHVLKGLIFFQVDLLLLCKQKPDSLKMDS